MRTNGIRTSGSSILCVFVIPQLDRTAVDNLFHVEAAACFFPCGRRAFFSWVPFGWAFLIIGWRMTSRNTGIIGLHHQVPWLGGFIVNIIPLLIWGWQWPVVRISFILFFFSQMYLRLPADLSGAGAMPPCSSPVSKSLITLAAHSSIPQGHKPFYKYKILHPVAWVLERLISDSCHASCSSCRYRRMTG